MKRRTEIRLWWRRLWFEVGRLCNRQRSHVIKWYLDKKTKESTTEIIKAAEELQELTDSIKLNDNIYIETIKTDHITDGVSYGLKIKIKDVNTTIGYTSDTKYFPGLAKFFADADILVFNISDIYEKDVRGEKSKMGHLGYDGSYRLLTECSANLKLAIASEFCCSNGDYRMNVVKRLTEQVGKNILPGEVGLKVDLPTKGICCSQCKRVMPIAEISIVAPEKEFGTIRYVCNRCQYQCK